MRSLRRLWSLAAVALLAAPGVSQAQGVLVAPHAVFMGGQNRGGSVTVMNRSTRPVEVELGMIYGFPTTDSTGRVVIQTIENPGAGEQSARDWVQALPRRFVIPGSSSQVVRFLARPPADLPDGEYWARLVLTSRAAAGAAGRPTTAADTSQIRVGVNVEVSTVIPVFYRKGAASTGVEVSQIAPVAHGTDSVTVRPTLTRTGRNAYLGQWTMQLRDAQGRVAAERSSLIAVYREMQPVLSIPLAGVAPGSYTVSFVMDTERTDVSERSVISGNRVERTATVVVPARP